MHDLETDILVIGSGIAGLFYAIHCASYSRVTIVTKSAIGESNTMYAQGGIAAVRDAHDSIENHVRDTLIAGDGLCDEVAVRMVATHAASCIAGLESLHVNFDRKADGTYDLHREGGHSHSRVLHTKDATGREIEQSLVQHVRSLANVQIIEHHFVVELITDATGCVGACVLNVDSTDDSHALLRINAKLTMLATGGGSQVYEHNTNPAVSTGDGYALARRAGARLQNMEFVQFHPTTLVSNSDHTFLISEAVRGFGARLTNADGEEFMHHYHPMASLAPRDIVSRAIVRELRTHNQPCVYLDLMDINRHDFIHHFPMISERCRAEGIDVYHDRIPVLPAAHYFCGGVFTDLRGRTTLPGLYACGEVACTGVHGANRLASNSLLEGLVFAREAARDGLLELVSRAHVSVGNCLGRVDRESRTEYAVLRRQLQQLMWNEVGICRNSHDLTHAIAVLASMQTAVQNFRMIRGMSVEIVELENMIDTSRAIATAALVRTQSVGCHWVE